VRFIALILTVIVALATAIAASADESNLLHNPAFNVGSGNSPDNWRTEAWINSPEAVQYRWIPPANGQPGGLEVINRQPDDARWMQTMALGPGWYHISVDARAANVPTDKTGVNISLLEDGIMSPDLRGTTGWQRIGFFLRIGGHGADIEVALRVGGFSNLNRGAGYFRDASVERIDAPPPGAGPVFDLDSIRKAAMPTPIGQLWTLVATFLLLGIIGYLGWRAYGEATIGVASISPPEAKPEVRGRSKKRRAHG